MSKTKIHSKKKSEVVCESFDKPKKKSGEDDHITRVEQHIIKPSNPAYEMLAEFCHKSKNLYNQGNYLLRQQFFAHEKQSSYEQLDKILKAKTEAESFIRQRAKSLGIDSAEMLSLPETSALETQKSL